MPRPRTKPLQAVIFDWDGTLLESADADSSAYLAMFRELGIPWGLSELAAHYTPNWHHVYRAAKIPVSKWDIADKLWAKHYAHHTPKLVPGTRRVLAWVARRYELGFVTSGDRTRVLRPLRPPPAPPPPLRPAPPLRRPRLRRRHVAKEATPRPAAPRTQTDVPQPARLRLRRRLPA